MSLTREDVMPAEWSVPLPAGHIVQGWLFANHTITTPGGVRVGLDTVHHAGRQPLVAWTDLYDALANAEGTYLWRVEVAGQVQHFARRAEGTERRYLSRPIDMSQVLDEFCLWMARKVEGQFPCPVDTRAFLRFGGTIAARVDANKALRATPNSGNAAARQIVLEVTSMDCRMQVARRCLQLAKVAAQHGTWVDVASIQDKQRCELRRLVLAAWSASPEVARRSAA